jgi:hypothetical protein
MNGPLYQFFVDDHRRLEKLLIRAISRPNEYDLVAYAQFRSGLLKHIKIEETVVIPEATKVREGKPLPVGEKVRLEHGALAALLVPPPSDAIVKTIRSILISHHRLEENQGGLYDLCERLSAAHLEELMEKIHSVSDVPVQPHNGGPRVLEATRRAVERAGFRLDIKAK